MTTTPETETHARHSARLLLGDALADGRPLRTEVRDALNRLLDGLAVSEDRTYNPDTETDTPEQRLNAARWQAAAWSTTVDNYRRLLAEVRHGVAAEVMS